MLLHRHYKQLLLGVLFAVMADCAHVLYSSSHGRWNHSRQVASKHVFKCPLEPLVNKVYFNLKKLICICISKARPTHDIHYIMYLHSKIALYQNKCEILYCCLPDLHSDRVIITINKSLAGFLNMFLPQFFPS